MPLPILMRVIGSGVLPDRFRPSPKICEPEYPTTNKAPRPFDHRTHPNTYPPADAGASPRTGEEKNSKGRKHRGGKSFARPQEGVRSTGGLRPEKFPQGERCSPWAGVPMIRMQTKLVEVRKIVDVGRWPRFPHGGVTSR